MKALRYGYTDGTSDINFEDLSKSRKLSLSLVWDTATKWVASDHYLQEKMWVTVVEKK